MPCKKCNGTGNVEYRENMGERNHAMYETFAKSCPYCLDKGLCPKCGQPMIAHLYTSSKMVTIDECYICGGFYLDSGELEVIRENLMSDQDREEYVHKLLSAKTDYLLALEKVNKSKEMINQGNLHRAAAITKLVNILGDKFKK